MLLDANVFKLSARELFLQSVEITFEKKIADAMNKKYGDYDYSKDVRCVYEEEFQKCLQEIKTLVKLELRNSKAQNKTRVLISGANRGVEIKYFENMEVHALDISKKALTSLKEDFSGVKTYCGNMNWLPFDDNFFDVVTCFRAINSYGIEMDTATEELCRVAKPSSTDGGTGLVIISVSNGYLSEQKLIRGQIDCELDKIDVSLPYVQAGQIMGWLEGRGYKGRIYSCPSEIIIVGW